MRLRDSIRDRLTLPAVCAPMFLVTGPEMVREACKAGLVGVLPRQNARPFEKFESWLRQIRQDLDAYRAENPDAKIGPLAVNLPNALPPEVLAKNLDACKRYGVEIIISATGNPAETTARVHDWGGVIFHDVTSLKFAEKAIAAGVDGLTCVGAGGGGHSGTVSHLVLVPKVREIFDGVILMAGAVTNGAGIRAAEVLGADLAYMGTRFIATQESAVDPAYKQMLVEHDATDLMYTPKIAGVAANWLKPSMERVGLDPKRLPVREKRGMGYDHLPEEVKPWVNLWSAGQGIELIKDIPTVAELVERLREEYIAACQVPDMSGGA